MRARVRGILRAVTCLLARWRGTAGYAQDCPLLSDTSHTMWLLTVAYLLPVGLSADEDNMVAIKYTHQQPRRCLTSAQIRTPWS